MDCPALVDRVLRYIREAPLSTHGTLSDQQYRSIPTLPIDLWNELGDALSANEKTVWFETQPGAVVATHDSSLSHAKRTGVPHEWWISARFDIKSMGSQITRLRRLGLLRNKWDSDLHHMMQQTLLAVMKDWHACIGSTHSDECTILLPGLTDPSAKHPFEGNVDKINSLIAAQASSKLNRLIMQRALTTGLRSVTFEFRGPYALERMKAFLRSYQLSLTHNKKVDDHRTRVSISFLHPDTEFVDAWKTDVMNQTLSHICDSSEVDIRDDVLDEVLPLLVFDCRRGLYLCERDALMLLVWRQWDCRRNSLSDVVYNEQRKLATLNSDDKLMWLAEQGLLPLPDGMAYGSLYERITTNHMTQNGNSYTRKELVHRAGTDVITMLRSGDYWTHITPKNPCIVQNVLSNTWVVFGSACSIDYNVLVFLSETEADFIKNQSQEAYLLTLALKKQLLHSDMLPSVNKKICVQLATLSGKDEGTVDWCFKGLPDELNNSIFYTHHLHVENQGRKNPIRCPLPVCIHERCQRALVQILHVLAHSNHSHRVKSILKDGRFVAMWRFLTTVKFVNLEWKCYTSLSLVDAYKRVAFQLGRVIALLRDERECCTKTDVIECFPDLEPALLRQNTQHPETAAALDARCNDFLALALLHLIVEPT